MDIVVDLMKKKQDYIEAQDQAARSVSSSMVSVSWSRLPNVSLIEILSFLPLSVGNGAKDSFISVCHQWLTCARAVSRTSGKDIADGVDNA